MKRKWILLPAILACFACGRVSQIVPSPTTVRAIAVVVPIDTPVPTATNVPSKIDDIPVYPDSIRLSSEVQDSTTEINITEIYLAEGASREAVFDFCEREMPKFDWVRKPDWDVNWDNGLPSSIAFAKSGDVYKGLVRIGFFQEGQKPATIRIDRAIAKPALLTPEPLLPTATEIVGFTLTPTAPEEIEFNGTEASCPGGCVPPNQPPGCNIKGDASGIYHMPFGAYYDRTDIGNESGDRWFCTEEEAMAAGWRRSKR